MDRGSFVSHLEELRRRFIIAVVVFLTASVVSYFFSHPLLDFLTAPLRQFQRTDLFFQKPYEAFLLHLKVAAFSGLIFSLPVIFYQGWSFVRPGLYPREKKYLFPVIVVSLCFFLIGAYFAYAVAVPFGLNFLLSYQTDSLKPLLNADEYFSFFSGMVLAFALLFDFPVIVTGLIALRVLSVKVLSSVRKFVILVIFIAAAILTPSPDPVSQLILALPLWGLFELSLIIGRRIEQKADPR